MKVWVIEAYSYDPEPVQGVFSSEANAIAWLTSNGWTFSESEWHNKDGWVLATVVEHKVQ